MFKTYQQRYTQQQRVAKVQKYQQTDPNKIIAIVQKHPKSKLPLLNSNKFLIDKNHNFGQIKRIIQKKINEVNKITDSAKESYFIFINGKSLAFEEAIDSIYNRQSHRDGILYLTYQQQQTF